MASQSWIGKTIGGRYKIDTLLGQGGMSAVYRATDPNLRRLVAIKLIHTHLSVNPDFVHRFKEEAAAVARLRHPNIVQVHDFNIDDDTYYMVMEYLIGETLQARLKRLNNENRRMPYDEVILYCQQLCQAVGYAHNHELIHRDIKPANVMLDVNGQAILMDFGIVKIIGGEYHTATGATIGTAMYMSPEQIRSERADERSDIYSLGVTLYEMLSGRTPYKADSVLTLIMKVLNDPLPDLAEIRAGIPDSLLAVVNKALEKDKQDRFQTMDEMAAALKGAQEQVAGISLAATVVDDAQVLSTVPADSPDEVGTDAELPETQLESSITLPAEETELEPSIDEHSREGQTVPAAPPLKDQSSEPTPEDQDVIESIPEERTGGNYRRIILIAAAVLLLGVITIAGYFYLGSQKAPDVQLVLVKNPPAAIDEDSAQYVVNLGMWETNSLIEELAFSPDGSRIGTTHYRDVPQYAKYKYYGGLWDIVSGTLQSYLLGHNQEVYGAAFSPDGQLFATTSDDSTVRLWDSLDGGLKDIIDYPESGGISSVAFSPTTSLLATGHWSNTLGLWDLNSGQLLRTLSGHDNSVRDVAFSPDGNLLASASEDHSIKLWQVSDGSLIETLRGHSELIHSLTFSLDGSFLASASDDLSVGLWRVIDGTLERSFLGHSEPVLDVAFSPDGSLLASCSVDGTLRIWRVSDGELLTILTGHEDGITSVDFSPDGNLLVSAAMDGVIHFWGLSEAIPVEHDPQDNTSLTETGTATPTPGSEIVVQETSPTTASLSTSDQWALYTNDDGLWISNPDGSALTNLFSVPVEAVHNLYNVVSPDGRLLAFLTAVDQFYDLTLHVIELPFGEEVLNLPLTSTQTEPDADAIQGDPKLEITSAISLPQNPAWSPDGFSVAFMGAQDGPTSDLYVYSLESGEITRLTDGISQGIKPIWSPDGGYIVHSGVSTLGSGAGYDLDGVWAAPLDGSEVNTLYFPDSGDEAWLGWTGPETLLVHSWSAACDKYDLRSVNILTGESLSIWEGNFLSAAFDPVSGTIALVVKETYPQCGDEAAKGLYLFPSGDPNPIQLASDEDVGIDGLSELVWHKAKEQFLMGTWDDLVAINISGELSHFPSPGVNSPLISPDGSMLAWRFTSLQENTGLWVAEWASEPRQIYDQHTGWALWIDDSSLLFIGSDGLYLAKDPDYEPTIVQPGFWASGMALAGNVSP